MHEVKDILFINIIIFKDIPRGTKLIWEQKNFKHSSKTSNLFYPLITCYKNSKCKIQMRCGYFCPNKICLLIFSSQFYLAMCITNWHHSFMAFCTHGLFKIWIEIIVNRNHCSKIIDLRSCPTSRLTFHVDFDSNMILPSSHRKIIIIQRWLWMDALLWDCNIWYNHPHIWGQKLINEWYIFISSLL